MFILIGFVSSLLLGVICGAVAISKGRNSWLWGILGFFFGVITLIVIAALPGVRPQWRVVDTSAARSVRHCPQCNAENDLESNFCTNCGTRLSLEPEVEGRVVAPARFVTPLVGLLVGLIFRAYPAASYQAICRNHLRRVSDPGECRATPGKVCGAATCGSFLACFTGVAFIWDGPIAGKASVAPGPGYTGNHDPGRGLGGTPGLGPGAGTAPPASGNYRREVGGSRPRSGTCGLVGTDDDPGVIPLF